MFSKGKVREEDKEICAWWMDIFGIAALKDRNFLKLSSGEQRLVLLARAFVKDPELLILDEPLHGLDLYNRRLVKDVIETFCCREGKTLIMVNIQKKLLEDLQALSDNYSENNIQKLTVRLNEVEKKIAELKPQKENLYRRK